MATLTKTPEDYLKEPYSRIVIPEADGTFSSEILEFPGCYSFGDTEQEALQNLEEAARNWIEACIQQNQNIPEPTGNNEYSGKVALRLPASLHRAAVRMAAREKTTLNQLLVCAVSSYIGATSYHCQLLQQVDDLFSKQAAIELTRSHHVLNQVNIFVTSEERRAQLTGVQWQPEMKMTTGNYRM